MATEDETRQALERFAARLVQTPSVLGDEGPAAEEPVMTLVVSPMFGRRAANAGPERAPNAASRS